MKQNYKRIVICTVLAVAIIISTSPAASVDSIAKTKSNTIQYNNKVFTKSLYKNTKKIQFCSGVVKDTNTLKKVYALLAKMKLKTKQPNKNEELKAGFVCVIIHTRSGKKKWYYFTGDNMSNNGKRYTILKNNPVDEIREIYDSVEN